MENIQLPHLPAQPLQVGLFKAVENASFLRQQLLDGNTDFEYAFLDASTLLSRDQVLLACFKAMNDALTNRLKSRNIHSEVVFSLSPNNNIAESFRRFGISDDSKNILAIKVGGDPAAVEKHLRENVQGELVPLSDDALDGMNDYARLKKIYKVDVKAVGQKEAETFVLGAMALKGS